MALDTPEQLKSELGGDAITIATSDATRSPRRSNKRFACRPTVVDGTVRVEQPDGHVLLGKLCEAFPSEIASITLGKPTLEDVFIARTGHRLAAAEDAARG